MEKLIQEINRLKKEKNAVILAHNYQRPEIFRVADYIGDSFALSRAAQKTDADIIVFCGVMFMAESAYILNPDKKVLIPDPSAGCPLADSITLRDLLEMKKKYSNVPVVSYVNTTAEIKANSDVCCTSSNAVKVVNSLGSDRVIFTPDENLASYVQKHTTCDIIVYPGFCPTHKLFKVDDIKKLKKQYPDAVVIAHPESDPEVCDIADYITSTEGMLRISREIEAKNIIIATETGMINRLKMEIPHKNFIAANDQAICRDMKKITLEKVVTSLREEIYQVSVDEDILRRAKRALMRMLEIG